MLTQEELIAKLEYNPETGIFKWRPKSPNYIRKREVAGGYLSNGYIVIRINYKQYYANRLAFLYMNGHFPKGQVGHKNRIRDDVS